VLRDAYVRRVVGWAMADHLRTDPALAALEMALTSRRPAPDLIHHTDRGGQSTADAYQAALAARGIIPSMSRVGDGYNNVLAESFFATFKGELIDTQPWPTRPLVRQAIEDGAKSSPIASGGTPRLAAGVRLPSRRAEGRRGEQPSRYLSTNLT
jgi:transposase InsO family protein